MAKDGFNGIHRDEIVNGVRAGRLRKAAAAQAKFHKGRVDYWTKEREAAHKKVVKSGFKLELNPNLYAGATASAYTSNKVRSAEVDHELIDKWQVCNVKVEQHKAKVREFQKWVSFLDPNNCDSNEGDSTMLDLSWADMDYFGMLGSTVED